MPGDLERKPCFGEADRSALNNKPVAMVDYLKRVQEIASWLAGKFGICENRSGDAMRLHGARIPDEGGLVLKGGRCRIPRSLLTPFGEKPVTGEIHLPPSNVLQAKLAEIGERLGLVELRPYRYTPAGTNPTVYYAVTRDLQGNPFQNASLEDISPPL